MWRWTRRLVILAVLAGAVAWARWALFKPPIVPVTVYRVARGPVEETVTNSKAGTVKSRRRAALSSELGGRVEALFVKEGDRVRKGDVLMRLVVDEYRAQAALQTRALEVARVVVAEACERAQLATREAQRLDDLVQSGLVSKQQLDRAVTERDAARATCDATRARVQQAEAALSLARVQEDKTVIRAPFDAVVAEVSAEIGEWITPAPPGIPIPPVIELIDPAGIYVSAPLDEVDVAKVHEGLPVRVTLDAYAGQSFAGRLVRVAPYVEDRQEQNRTFEIEVELADRDASQRLLPGTSADVEVILQVRPDVVRIPAYALMQNAQVLVVRDEALVAVDVKTGLRNWDFVEVVDGLSVGEMVVVSIDRVEVKAGARVRIESETTR
jgi:HlyD family secretion protein